MDAFQSWPARIARPGLCAAMLAGALLTSSAWAQEGSALASLINEYRNAPQNCEGRQTDPVGPLAPEPALAAVQVGAGVPLQEALKDAGYQAARAQAIRLTGPRGPDAAMEFIKQRYCRQILDARYAQIGVSREGNTWRIVLAQPLLAPDLEPWQEAGKKVLALTNAARAEPRECGKSRHAAAPPLVWNGKLGAAALAHSRDMASRNYFRHVGADGSRVGERAKRADYAWRRVGENIAAGQGSPEQVVSAWLNSPHHCANIMNRDFAEMAAAYVVNPKSDGAIYWTQVFGTSR